MGDLEGRLLVGWQSSMLHSDLSMEVSQCTDHCVAMEAELTETWDRCSIALVPTLYDKIQPKSEGSPHTAFQTRLRGSLRDTELHT